MITPFQRNKTYLLFTFSYFLCVICFTYSQYSYSQSSTTDNNIDVFLDTLIEKGDALVDENKYNEAIKYYDKGLEISPDDIETLFKKGDALYGLGNYTDAIQYYDKVLEINSINIDALLNKGVALGNLGKYQEEIQYYDKVLEINPNDTDALYNKGMVFYNLGNYNEAMGFLDKVLEIDPTDTEALNSKNDALNELNYNTDSNNDALNELNYNTDSNNDADNKPDNIESNYESTQEGDWMEICNMVKSALYHSCDIYVNDNGILTTKGERAFGCIRNGALLGAGALTLGLPPALITKGLEMLSVPTGCDGIVNFQALDAIGNLNTILGFLN